MVGLHFLETFFAIKKDNLRKSRFCMFSLSFHVLPFQIYDMILVRHGLMIVGDPIGGKTSAFKALAAALSQLHEKRLMDENQVRE